MKKEIADKWIAALESGKYEQGLGALNSGGQFCCLGVLCEVLEIFSRPIVNHYGDVCFAYGAEAHDEVLPNEALILSGIKTRNGTIKFVSKWLDLTELNDERGRSFKQIAAYIRRNWERL